MEAAEGVFGGEFDHVNDTDEDVQMAGPGGRPGTKPTAKLKAWHLYRRHSPPS